MLINQMQEHRGRRRAHSDYPRAYLINKQRALYGRFLLNKMQKYNSLWLIRIMQRFSVFYFNVIAGGGLCFLKKKNVI